METDERDLTPQDEISSEPVSPDDAQDDDARFAPPSSEHPEQLDETDEQAEPAAMYADMPLGPNIAVTDGMDIEAALAAVSTLSDMVAEQEAAEQVRIAQEEAEAQAAAERQARLEHPERFFPVPPMSSLHRGQMASVIPALVLIVTGAWLTFILTTTRTTPDALLLTAITAGGIGLTLLIRWLSSGRWARGSLFFGLMLLLVAGSLLYLSQPLSPGFVRGWPLLLVALGIAILLTGVLAIPRSNRLILPGTMFVVAGIAGLVISLGVIGGELASTVGSLWPIAVAVVVVIWGLPFIFRQRG